MKKKINSAVCIFFMMSMVVCLTSCSKKVENYNLWENATYKEDTDLGSGDKTIAVEVKAEEKSVTFTIHTDKEMLGEALKEHNLISGEQGAYGMYVKVVNGIKADYDEDKHYWGLNINGESSMTGVDGVEIADGEHYELIRTKGE